MSFFVAPHFTTGQKIRTKRKKINNFRKFGSKFGKKIAIYRQTFLSKLCKKASRRDWLKIKK
ncbi:hypothetical protein HMPREF9176_1137 [Streptococcus downei F0415]|nr:hypothetical protein HMPREF9176_1137 [Streptococcus downei F0415]